MRNKSPQESLDGGSSCSTPRAGGSHRIVEHHILLGQLQQHGVIKELADAHILTQALWRGQGRHCSYLGTRTWPITLYKDKDCTFHPVTDKAWFMVQEEA